MKVIHKIWCRFKPVSTNKKIYSIFSIIITYISVCICWIFFRAENVQIAFQMIKRIFTGANGITHIYVPAILAIVLVAVATVYAIILSEKQKNKIIEGQYVQLNLDTFKGCYLFFVILGLILAFAYTAANPFIYFQF